jgi:general secretion pathway protein N
VSRRATDWQRSRRSGLRWAAGGALLGLAAALVAFAPAAWLADAVASASGERLLLADAHGSVWAGSAVPVLTGGPGSGDASALPGRLNWTLGLDGWALGLTARHACCINGELRLRVEPGFGRLRFTLPASAAAIGQWPAAWLAGLGAPFNTMQFGGQLSLTSGGLVVDSARGRWTLQGGATLTMNGLSSRVSPLDTLGSYRLVLAGGEVAQITLSTLNGPLFLSGSGQWSASGLRFRGEARAAPGSESALNNLLNILGRRQGTLAVLSIG